MRRISALLTAALLLLALAGCGIKPVVDFSGAPSNSPSPSQEPEEDTLIYPDEEDYAIGYMGDTFRTDFFDMRLEDAYTCYEFDGITADEGYKLLVATIWLYNYTDVTQPMFFTDFEIWWDAQEGEDPDDAYDFPLYIEEELADGTYEYDTVSDQQLPIQYDLSIRGAREGILLYQVPEGSRTYSIAFLEFYEDDSIGALFEVRFSAPLAQ
ncbi:MAG: hypothetical protein ACI4OU_00200 [Candidatus Enterenecus sp.]